MADYVVELDHEGGKGMLRHKDKVGRVCADEWRQHFFGVDVVVGWVGGGLVQSDTGRTGGSMRVS